MTDLIDQDNYTINCRGKLLSLERPVIMGILNINDDSFYNQSRVPDLDSMIRLAEKHVKEGALILDVGAMSTRPGAKEIPLNAERDKMAEAISHLSRYFPEMIISADTYRSAVAKSALEAGAHIINDIGAAVFDHELPDMVASYRHVPYVLMHNRAKSENMDRHTEYGNIMEEVTSFFYQKIKELGDKGILDIIIDPGIGFSKKVEHNFELIAQLETINMLGRPLLMGLSRKSFIYKTLGTDANKSLNGTTAMHMYSLLNGANILRVHDVGAAYECIQLFLKLKAYH